MEVKMQMKDVMLSNVTVRQAKENTKYGERTYIDIMYLGGFMKVEVPHNHVQELKQNVLGTATISMVPIMSVKSVKTKDNDWNFIESSFQDMKLLGFEIRK